MALAEYLFVSKENASRLGNRTRIRRDELPVYNFGGNVLLCLKEGEEKRNEMFYSLKKDGYLPLKIVD